MSMQPLKQIAQRLLAKVIRFILSRSQLRSKLILALNHYPRTKLKIKTMMINCGLSAILYTPVEKTGESKINLEEGSLNCNFKLDGQPAQERESAGVNFEKKSPLERWFN